MTHNIPEITTLEDIARRHNVLFIDIWGVLHDGVQPYDGSREALRKLTDAGKKTILISNAPRLAPLAQDKLREMGIADDDYTAIVTSGETTRDLLTGGAVEYISKGNYYMLGGARDGNLLEDAAGFTQVNDIDAADFILLIGYNDDMTGHDDVLPFLKRFRDRDLFMINSNPDKRVERITGETELCAGTIADSYRGMGGAVREIGKPYPEIYQLACALYDIDAKKDRIACIGDNMDTDIKGACENGFNGYLVASGMHCQHIDAHGIDAFLHDYAQKPTGIINAFRI